MKILLITIMTVAVFLLTANASASQEGVLSFSEFEITSNGIGNSGVVIVKGNKDASGTFQNITVTAFGKVIQISTEILSQIPSKYQNGIQLTYEAGYVQVGGRTLYIQFQKGFTSGIDERTIISIQEDGSQRILR